MPDTGMPAPCNVAAFAANYISRVDYTIALVGIQQNPQRPLTLNRRQTSREQAAVAKLWALLASLPSASDEQPGRTLGLRIVGYNRNEVPIWAAVNSVVAQQNNGKAEFKEKAEIEAVRNKTLDILRNDEQCRKFLAAIAGLNIDELIKAVESQRIYDGKNSTIGQLAAGFI